MKFPFRFRRHYNKLFPTSQAAHIRQLRHMLETSRNESSNSLTNLINETIYNNSRSIQSSNLRDIRDSIFNISGANNAANDGFIESLIVKNLKNLLNNELQSSFFGSDRRISSASFSENQIASQLVKMLQRGKRNL